MFNPPSELRCCAHRECKLGIWSLEPVGEGVQPKTAPNFFILTGPTTCKVVVEESPYSARSTPYNMENQAHRPKKAT